MDGGTPRLAAPRAQQQAAQQPVHFGASTIVVKRMFQSTIEIKPLFRSWIMILPKSVLKYR